MDACGRIEDVIQKHNAGFRTGLDEQTAGEKAYSSILPEL